MKKILVLNLLFMSALANENIDKVQEVSNILAQNSYEPNYFGMVLGLFLVIGMIYITGFLYQKLTKANTFNQNSYINKAQVISTTSIGQGRNLHVVKIGQSACLIGSTQNNITFLKDIEIQEEAGEKNGENS